MQQIELHNRSYVKNKLIWIGLFAVGLIVIYAWRVVAASESKSDFPDGYDAVQAAPDSHKVLFENALVRVLEVPIPPVGKPEPMHHHH
jgi:hypothetical protein